MNGTKRALGITIMTNPENIDLFAILDELAAAPVAVTRYTVRFWADTGEHTIEADGAAVALGTFKSRAAAVRRIRQIEADLGNTAEDYTIA